MEYPLFVRFGQEWHNPDWFIQPNDGPVVATFEHVAGAAESPDDAAMLCWRWVVENINYPLTSQGRATDYHLLRAYPMYEGLFGTKYRVNLVAPEFFELPCEVLGHLDDKGRMWADCDGCALLLGSLLRNALPESRVRVIIGNSLGLEAEADHAWVDAWVYDRWLTMETTLSSLPRDVVDRASRIAGAAANGVGNYLPYLLFNDRGWETRRPLVFNKQDEVSKLRGISALWQWPTKTLGV